MRGIIDRIEDKIAVIELEEGRMIDIKVKNIIGDVKEGKVIEIEHECENVLINEYETIERRKYMNEIVKDLWN